jgi:hypothetical protein
MRHKEFLAEDLTFRWRELAPMVFTRYIQDVMISFRAFILLLALQLLLLPGACRGDSTGVPYVIQKSEPGEKCAVCGTSLSEEDVALIFKGRRVPLDREMVTEFLKNPERYFIDLQPKGALFQENGNSSGSTALGGVSGEWFLAGLFLLVSLIFAGLSGYAAVSKGLKPIPHFFLGLTCNIFGYVYTLTRPSFSKPAEIPHGLAKIPSTSNPIPCDACGTLNHPSAKACTGCAASLNPRIESEVARV